MIIMIINQNLLFLNYQKCKKWQSIGRNGLQPKSSQTTSLSSNPKITLIRVTLARNPHSSLRQRRSTSRPALLLLFAKYFRKTFRACLLPCRQVLSSGSSSWGWFFFFTIQVASMHSKIAFLRTCSSSSTEKNKGCFITWRILKYVLCCRTALDSRRRAIRALCPKTI